ncbi:hypothetical protein HOE04_00785 [archaeon]|jgi:hypothetical protein|nr:hypothetical protein [archaeon]
MSLDISLDISPREFVEGLSKGDGLEGDYRFLSECVCHDYVDAVVAEAELVGLSEHPVLSKLVMNY